MKKLTCRYPKNANYRKPFIALVIMLFLAGCNFENIYQPYHADPNAYFDVPISARKGSPGHDMPRFGALLPVGWMPQDSIAYFDSDSLFVGTLIYSDSLSQTMSSIDPPPENYYWWVAQDTISIGKSTYHFDFRIYTDAQTGSFFIDYMLGGDGVGLDYIRSNDHLIIIGDIQGCAPEGILLTTQAEVDSFQINYPGCSQVAGDISISGNDINNLNGINAVTDISGSLRIFDNTVLANLTGLNNLTTIGGTLSITNNQSLVEVQGLNNVTSLGRDLLIKDNLALTQINGLNSLSTIGRDLSIDQNSVLFGLPGMNILNFIGGDLTIRHNDSLSSLTGLDNLTSIEGTLVIDANGALTSLIGLENLTDIGGSVRIGDWFEAIPPGVSECGGNPSLTSLEGLNNLISIGGWMIIQCNESLTSLTGLDTLTYIGGDLQVLDNESLTSLTGLENVTSIGGDLLISNNEFLTSLTGLENVTSIGGDLWIHYNESLTSLTGLEKVTSIGGDLWVLHNQDLTSLTGLQNVTSIGGDLRISENYSLISLIWLYNVNSIGGDLRISENHSLISLTGLDNVAPASIENLSVIRNHALSNCAVESICDYLSSPNGTIVIYGNDTGCNSQWEVEDACETVSISELNALQYITIYPNPTRSTINIGFPTKSSKITYLTISNTRGQHLITQPITALQTEINISHMPSGIYIVKLWNDNDVMVQKVIKQ